MVQIRHTTEASRRRAPGRALPWLSRRTGFWTIAFSFLAVAAFSTAPNSLYGLNEQQEHLSSLTITIVYAVYALGIVVSLLLAGHVSDWSSPRSRTSAAWHRGRSSPDCSPLITARSAGDGSTGGRHTPGRTTPAPSRAV